MSNLKLWESLQATDPKYTKQFNRGGFKGTATNGTYIAKRLTEAFGPCGTGWKLVMEDERVIPGPNNEQLHVVRCHIEYIDPTVTEPALRKWMATGPQFGQTKLVLCTNDGRLIFDEEAPKKSLTDAMSKCASLLGVAADVHLGLYDDNKYMNEVSEKFGSVQPKAGTPIVGNMPNAPITEEQWKAMFMAMTNAGLSEKAFNKKYNIPKSQALPASSYEEAMSKIKEFADKKASKNEEPA